jgi:hypothetical protein
MVGYPAFRIFLSFAINPVIVCGTPGEKLDADKGYDLVASVSCLLWQQRMNREAVEEANPAECKN